MQSIRRIATATAGVVMLLASGVPTTLGQEIKRTLRTPIAPVVDRANVRIISVDTPGVSITKRPIGRVPGVDRASGVVYSNLQPGTGYQAHPMATGLIDYTEYVSTLSASGQPCLDPATHATFSCCEFIFVGGPDINGGILFFDFFQNDGTLSDSVGVLFPNTGTFIWTISGSFSVPTEGIMTITANDDPGVGPVTRAQWFAGDAGPDLGSNCTIRPIAPTLALSECDACPPAGGTFALNTYLVTGTASGASWSWRITSTDPPTLPTGFVSVVERVEPGVLVGGAINVAQAFADSINAYAAAHSCGATSLQATAVSVPPDAELRIRVGGNAAFDLYVGGAGFMSFPNTLVPLAPASVTFNPEISKLDLSGNDCNDNFQDDEIDIATGVSFDTNGNGIPDECEPGFSCVIPPSGMVGWWPVDEASGTVADELMAGNDGVMKDGNSPGDGVTTGPLPAAGFVGGARSFDGINDFIEVPTSPELDFGTGPFTIDAWISLDPGALQTNNRIVGKRDSTGGANGRGFVFKALSTGQLEIRFLDGSGTQVLATSTGTVSEDAWTHVAVTVGPVNDPMGDCPVPPVDTVSFYIDGQFAGSGVPCPRLGGSIDTTAPLRIGNHPNFGDPFDGRIDEVELFDRVLSQAEVQALFDAGSEGKCKDDCNANGFPDWDDIAKGRSQDADMNGIPDECECVCPGDIDGDCDTDVFDFGIFAANFGTSGHAPFTNGDLDGDGDVDVFDFGLFAANFGCPI